MTFKSVSVIGFGEAGPIFARGFRDSGTDTVRAFDIACNAETRPVFAARGEAASATVEADRQSAVAGAGLIVSTVTADQTEAAAQQVAPHLQTGQVYLDLNSCSPQQKAAAARHVEARGASFVEGVAMDTVPLKGFQVPLLLAGPHAADLEDRLAAHGMVVETVGPRYGQACSIKLLRSVIIKGLEALFAESVAAASVLGVEDRVIGTLDQTFPGLDWRRVAGYHLSRLAVHGKRRAAEMRESATTIADLGIEPIMARAIAERHDWGVALGLKEVFDQTAPPEIGAFVAALNRVDRAA